MNFNIITDSTSDITQLNAKEKNIKVVPLRILFEDVEYHDGINISTEEFYTKLETSKILPQTSQPSPEDFVKIFEEAKTKNEAVLVITLSSKLKYNR
jgi:DegV family protein with EDD domain